MAQWVKNPPAMQETQETWVPSLGQEDPLEEEMAAHSRILACEMPWAEEPGRLQSIGLTNESDTTKQQNGDAFYCVEDPESVGETRRLSGLFKPVFLFSASLLAHHALLADSNTYVLSLERPENRMGRRDGGTEAKEEDLFLLFQPGA